MQGTEALHQLKSKVERLTERRPKDRESKEKTLTMADSLVDQVRKVKRQP